MEYFWKKKLIVSYLCAILVVLIHTTQVEANYNINAYSGMYEVLRFFQFDLSAVAVPMFFVISGFLFFRNYSHARYFTKLKDRIKTLFVPYILWNTLYLFYNIITTKLLGNYFVGRKQYYISLQNIFTSIFLYKGNEHFWFVFDLIVFTIISPILYEMIKKKTSGAIAILGLIILQHFGVGYEGIFFRSDAIVFFVFGGFVGIHAMKLMIEKRGKVHITLALFLQIGIWVLLYMEEMQYIHILPEIMTIILLLDCCIFWVICDCFIGTIKQREMMRDSFWIYAMHGMILPVAIKGLFILLPQNLLFAPIVLVFSVIATLFGIHLICYVLRKKNSRIYIVLGGR